MKLSRFCGTDILLRPSAERSVISMVLQSPFLSWTQGASITPIGAKGGDAPERVC
jgi:hypothetical protein